MANKLISLKDAVSKFTHDGMLYASGAAGPVGSDSIFLAAKMARQGAKIFTISATAALSR